MLATLLMPLYYGALSDLGLGEVPHESGGIDLNLAVFGALTNLENDIKWRSEWVETRKTSEGPIGVGSTFCLTGKFLGRRVPTKYEAIEYETNRSAAWKAVSEPLPLTFQRILERVEVGTTVLIS